MGHIHEDRVITFAFVANFVVTHLGSIGSQSENKSSVASRLTTDGCITSSLNKHWYYIAYLKQYNATNQTSSPITHHLKIAIHCFLKKRFNMVRHPERLTSTIVLRVSGQ